MSLTTMGEHRAGSWNKRMQAHVLSYRAAILPVMHFSPHTTNPQACWHCTHFQALVYRATAARCLRAGRLSIQVAPTSLPANHQVGTLL